MRRPKQIPWRIKEGRKRKRERNSRRGRELEAWMKEFLAKLKARGDIHGFIVHEHGSAADHQGKDFTVWRKSGKRERAVSFNITISVRRGHEFQIIHPDIPIIVIPPEMKPETIRRRILGLLEDG